VKRARDTPVIVLEKVSIPGLGTFSARVLLYPPGFNTHGLFAD
jgi:hypothetical protein